MALRLNAPFLPTFGSSANAAPANAPGTPNTYRTATSALVKAKHATIIVGASNNCFSWPLDGGRGKKNYFENTHSEDQVVSVGKVC